MAHKKPHIALRLVLQGLSFVLCIVLTAALLGTVVLADLNHLMSAGGLRQLINAVLLPTSAPYRVTPAVGAAGVRPDSFTLPGDLDLDDIPEDVLTGEDPEDMLDSLIDWVYAEAEESAGEALDITKEQLQQFVEESTASDFVAEKLAGFAEDFINGTETTTITAEEIMQLLEENAQLIEETFQTEITEELKQQISTSLEKAMAEADLNTIIRQEVFEGVKETINESAPAGFTWAQMQPMVQLLCADSTLYCAIGICAVLMLLLCLLNYYNVPAGLTWISLPAIVLGVVVTVPLVLLQSGPELLAGAMDAQALSIIASFADVLLPIHSGLLTLGVVLLVISIIWRILRRRA